MYFLEDLLAQLNVNIEASELLPLQLGARLLNDNSKSNTRFDEFWTTFSAACSRENLAIVFDELGIFLGHIAWHQHLVEMPTVSARVADDLPSVASAEIVEITAFGVTTGNASKLLCFLRRKLFSSGGQVAYTRYRANKEIAKRTNVSPRSKQSSSAIANTKQPFFLTMEGADIKHAILLFFDEALLVSKAIMLFARDSQISARSVSDTVNRVHHPLLLEQARLFFDANKQLVGFVSWAWVENVQSDWALNAGKRTIDQWNYGEKLCICDAVAAPGYENLIFNFIRSELHVDEETVLCSAADRRCSQHRRLNRATIDVRDFSTIEYADAAA